MRPCSIRAKVCERVIERVEREAGLSCRVSADLPLDKSVVEADATVHALSALS